MLCIFLLRFLLFFFFNDTATTEIYTLSLHDALPLSGPTLGRPNRSTWAMLPPPAPRSEEHTSELQSRVDLVCRLLLEKKKKNRPTLSTSSKNTADLNVCLIFYIK